MPSTIYLITGGCRSGKSSYAETMCKNICNEPIYLATSTAWDDDFTKRIQRHQADRGPEWTTIEEPLRPSNHATQFKGRAVLVDCLTLWLTNFMTEEGAFTSYVNKETEEADTDTAAKALTSDATIRALTAIKKEFDTLIEQWDATFFFVTNELGSGTHANDHFTRKFVDAQGWFNQHVAAKANRVVHMVSGIPNVIKDFLPQTPITPIAPTSVTKGKQDEAIILDKILSTRGLKMDDKGYFLVKVEQGLIVATFHSSMINDKGEVCDLAGKKIPCHGNNRHEAMKRWQCRTAKELTVEIFGRWDGAQDAVSVSHASYIGREAQRAEYCLYAGTPYQQD
jgi:adenosylcobinamide kinase/adenosylcobinamide-phosphate guanylyltransferase